MRPINKLALVAVVVMVASCDTSKDATNEMPREQEDAESTREVPEQSPAADAGASGVFEVVPQDAISGDSRTAPCSVDKVNGQQVSDLDIVIEVRELIVGGWVSSPNQNAPEEFSVILQGVGSYMVAGVTGVPRPDLPRVLKAEGLAQAGFNARGSLELVPAGDYAIVLEHDFEGATVRCETKARISIRQSP